VTSLLVIGIFHNSSVRCHRITKEFTYHDATSRKSKYFRHIRREYFFLYLKQEVLGRTNLLLSLIRHGPQTNDAFNNSSIVACVSVAMVTFLPSHCLAMIEDTYIDTQTDGKNL
jgi:hypothetical protein